MFADWTARSLSRVYRLRRISIASDRNHWTRSVCLERLELRLALSANVSQIDPFPDVDYFGASRDWGVNAINAPEVSAQGFTGNGVVVAVIDTGVDLDHVDLDANIWTNEGEIPGNARDDDGNGFVDDMHGWDFVQNDNAPADTESHGTHVAGTIAAEKNALGATGVAYDATIMPIQVLDSDGFGSFRDIAAGIEYAVDNGAQIINLSLGGGGHRLIQQALSYAEDNNVLVVAAAGNDGTSAPDYPARYSESLTNVISVGAHDRSDELASFSNFVGNTNAIQVDAPGISVYSTIPDDRFATFSGTSMSAPHVAGLAALALSADPTLQVEELRRMIVEGADRVIADSDSAGGINAAHTVALARAAAANRLLLAGDVDLDGIVGFSDFVILISNFNLQDATRSDGDLDGDGDVDFSDFVIVSASIYSPDAIQAESVPGQNTAAGLSAREADAFFADVDWHAVPRFG